MPIFKCFSPQAAAKWFNKINHILIKKQTLFGPVLTAMPKCIEKLLFFTGYDSKPFYIY